MQYKDWVQQIHFKRLINQLSVAITLDIENYQELNLSI